MPMHSEPLTLTSSVPSGQASPHSPCACLASRKRAMAPQAPPRAT